MQKNRERIVQEALYLFNSRGYKGVTISDLATRLGMSKKTIYQYFTSKEQIAAAVIDQIQSHIHQTIDTSVSNPSDDPRIQIEQVLRKIKDEIMRLSPLFLEDIQKLLPDLWHHIEQYRAEKLKFIERLLLQSQEKGLVKNIEPHLALLIFVESLQALIRPDSVYRHGFPMEKIFDALIQIFCTGIMENQTGEIETTE